MRDCYLVEESFSGNQV